MRGSATQTNLAQTALSDLRTAAQRGWKISRREFCTAHLGGRPFASASPRSCLFSRVDLPRATGYSYTYVCKAAIVTFGTIVNRSPKNR